MQYCDSIGFRLWSVLAMVCASVLWFEENARFASWNSNAAFPQTIPQWILEMSRHSRMAMEIKCTQASLFSLARSPARSVSLSLSAFSHSATSFRQRAALKMLYLRICTECQPASNTESIIQQSCSFSYRSSPTHSPSSEILSANRLNSLSRSFPAGTVVLIENQNHETW